MSFQNFTLYSIKVRSVTLNHFIIGHKLVKINYFIHFVKFSILSHSFIHLYHKNILIYQFSILI